MRTFWKDLTNVVTLHELFFNNYYFRKRIKIGPFHIKKKLTFIWVRMFNIFTVFFFHLKNPQFFVFESYDCTVYISYNAPSLCFILKKVTIKKETMLLCHTQLKNCECMLSFLLKLIFCFRIFNRCSCNIDIFYSINVFLFNKY